MTRKIFLALFIFLLTVNCASADIDLGEGFHRPEGFSEVYITNSDGTAIQNAVEHIKDGGTIILSGRFNLKRGINIKKSLTIKADSGTTAVLNLSGVKGFERVIRCQGDNITLENLVIRGGNQTNGGGVKVDAETKTMTLTNCEITDNTALLGGGGIHSDAKKLIMTNCKITNNKVTVGGGGGMSVLGGEVEMRNCEITDNTSTFVGGGGIGFVTATVNMTNCKITGNVAAHENGGGMALTLKTTVNATNCTISGNKSKKADTYDIYKDSNSTYTSK